MVKSILQGHLFYVWFLSLFWKYQSNNNNNECHINDIDENSAKNNKENNTNVDGINSKVNDNNDHN